MADLHARVDNDVISQNPNLVVILVGRNGMSHGTPGKTDLDNVADFYNSYASLIKRIKDKDNCSFVICSIPSAGERRDVKTPNATLLEMYNAQVKKLVSDMNIPYCDLRQAFVRYYAQNKVAATPDKDVLTVDGTHSNTPGNKIIADKLWPYLC